MHSSKILTQAKFKGSKIYQAGGIGGLQSCTGYLGLVLVFVWNTAQGFFASIDKAFTLAWDWAFCYQPMGFRHLPEVS